jgi:hypothetical protein
LDSKNNSKFFRCSVKIFAPIRNFSVGKNFPACPYMKAPCGEFSSKDKSSVCCSFSNSSQENYDFVLTVSVYRCCWLPSWVKDGFHEAKFCGGVLHGDGERF